MRRGLIIGMLAALVALPLGASATHPGRRGKIAYAGFPKGADKPEIYVRGKDGSGILRLTRNRRWDTDPVWSASGRHIAWSCRGRTVKADPTFTADICVMKPDGSKKQVFSFARSVRTPDFAPNGRHIVYVTDGPNPVVDGRATFPSDEVWVMDRDGSDRKRLTDNTISEAAVSWSPAKGEVAFAGLSRRRGGIWILDLQTKKTRLVASDANVAVSSNRHGSVISGELDWSPNGRWIVFTRSTSDGTDIVAVHRSGDRVRRVTKAPPADHDTNPAWAPDGKTIVYRHASEGTSGPGLTCLVAFPPKDGPVTTNHDDCPGHNVTEFDFSWQPRPRS